MARAPRHTRSAGAVAVLIAAVSLWGAPAAFAAGTSAEPAPTPGCVFTGGAYTCGGVVPPDVEPAPVDPAGPADPADPGSDPSEDPDPSTDPDTDPAEPAPGTSTDPTPAPDPADSPGTPAEDGDDSDAQGVPLWIPLAIGGVAAVVVAGVAYAVVRRRGDSDDGDSDDGDPSA